MKSWRIVIALGLGLSMDACAPARPRAARVPPVSSTFSGPRILGAVTVTALSAPVYSAASAETKVSRSVAFGEKLPLLEHTGDWLRVKVVGYGEAWVKASEIWPDEPCPVDRDQPLVLEEPLFRFDAPHPGRVVLEATFDSQATLQSVTVLENTFGEQRYEEIAEKDLRGIRWGAPVRNCKPMGFVYTFTRHF